MVYEYKIKLEFKIESCVNCPFRHERTFHEDVRSMDKLTGVVGITRITSHCTLRNEPIIMNEVVDSYTSKCPLKGNVSYIDKSK